MIKLLRTLQIALILVSALAIVSCSSETPETQKLYTDSKQMWDDLNKAFLLPKGQERIDMMRKVLDEQWDVKIVANLEQYLKDAPSGKYSKDAKTLLDQAKTSDIIRNLGHARPLLESMGGAPKTEAEVDSMAKAAEGGQSDQADSGMAPSGDE